MDIDEMVEHLELIGPPFRLEAERAADVYDRPLAALFLPAPPEE
jgi:hypothetical protein